MADSVVIIDSSDDESNQQPAKKRKLDNECDDLPTEFLILDVKSLADTKSENTENSLEVIEIDSDENASGKENLPTKNEKCNEIKQGNEGLLANLKHKIRFLKLPSTASFAPENIAKKYKEINEIDDDVMVVDLNDSDEIKPVNDIRNLHNTDEVTIKLDERKVIEQIKCSMLLNDDITIVALNKDDTEESTKKSEILEKIVNNKNSTNGENTSDVEENLAESPKLPLIQGEIKEQTSYELLEDFLKICLTPDVPTKYKNLIKSKSEGLRTKYSDAETNYTNSKDFIKLLNSSIAKIHENPSTAIFHFKTIYEELKVHRRRELTLTRSQEDHLSKLSKMMKLLDKKIRKLEQTEVDFDEDNDSTYIQLDRYKQRFVQVHKKYCKLLKQDAYATRLTHRKLDFSSSNYVEINRAIDRFFLKGNTFPLFEEVDSCIRAAVKEARLNLSEAELIIEVRKIHKEMGTIIQRRRRCELDEAHNVFLGQETDPAIEDENLKEQLDKQLVEAKQKMEEVFETYTKKQLEGENPPVSPDSDDSNLESSEEEVKDDD